MATSKDKKKKRRGEDEAPEKYVPENAASSAFTGPSFTEGLVGPQELGGGGGDQTARLQMLADLWGQQIAAQKAMQIRPEEAYMAEAKARDPMGYEQRQTAARQARDPWAAGGLFEGRGAADLYTPEEILASQGNTAQNQILRNRRPIEAEQAKALSGVPAGQRAVGEFDPEELARQNEIYRANRTYI